MQRHTSSVRNLTDFPLNLQPIFPTYNVFKSCFPIMKFYNDSTVAVVVSVLQTHLIDITHREHPLLPVPNWILQHPASTMSKNKTDSGPKCGIWTFSVRSVQVLIPIYFFPPQASSVCVAPSPQMGKFSASAASLSLNSLWYVRKEQTPCPPYKRGSWLELGDITSRTRDATFPPRPSWTTRGGGKTSHIPSASFSSSASSFLD